MSDLLVGPLLALAAIAGVLVIRHVRRAIKTLVPPPAPTVLQHSINDELCIGCEACVVICPTDVLELNQQSKSRVVRGDQCIQCRKCAEVCPTGSLVMHIKGQEPPPIEVPDLNEHYESRVPGLYLIGEAAGKPLVKNGINLGRAVVEHIRRKGGAAGQDGIYDVIIVGSGPAGLSAAMTCIKHQISHIILEKEELVAANIARYPKGKHLEPQPAGVRCLGLLPVWECTKEALIEEWNRIARDVGLHIRLSEEVEDVRPEGGLLSVKTSRDLYCGRHAILAVGGGKPNRLGVPGESPPLVLDTLDDPESYRGKVLVVVGAGNSAVEAALRLAEAPLDNRVILVVRSKRITRASPRNMRDLQSALNDGRLHIEYGARPLSFGDCQMILQRAAGEPRPVSIDRAFILIGTAPPRKWLESLGISYVPRPHGRFKRAATDRLVEQMGDGALEVNDRPGLPISFLPQEEGEQQLATIRYDMSQVMAQVRSAHQTLAPEPGATSTSSLFRRTRVPLSIKAPEDEEELTFLPQKLRIDQETLTTTLQGLKERMRRS